MKFYSPNGNAVYQCWNCDAVEPAGSENLLKEWLVFGTVTDGKPCDTSRDYSCPKCIAELHPRFFHGKNPHTSPTEKQP